MKKDFIGLLERLVRTGVDFVLVGGFAGVVHGCTYVTQDIDICCDFAGGNLLRLQEALSETHPVHRMTPGRKKLELNEKNYSGFNNLYLDTDIGQLDCLSFIEGVGDFEQLKNASVLIKVADIQIKVVNLDALIASKKALNRPRDQEAVRQLEAIKKLSEHNQD
jgi:hypothetical protein